ncbi:MAG: tetratricopeptide repeat protein [Candidatus Melainabacteria bacterium]|nr:tetratricopeptide repeat protein [Candidatus Melainabacteria bacterium]
MIRKAHFCPLFTAGCLVLSGPLFAANPGAEHREKAEFYFFHGDTMRAIDEYEESLKLEPQNWQAHLSVASLYLRKEESQKAREHLLEVVKIRPKDRDARILLAQVFTRTGDDIGAAQQLEAALALGCESELLHTLLGFAFLRSGNLPKAEEQFRLSIGKESKDNSSATTGLALVLMRQEKLSEALAAIDQTLANNTADPDAHKIKGDILTLLKRNDEAILEYKSAVQLRPDFSEAFLAHGNVYFASGDMEHAIDLFKKATSCKTNGPQCYYALALAFEKSGKLSDAAGEYANGAFLEKDKSLAAKIQAHAQRLRTISQMGKSGPQDVMSAQYESEKLGVLKHLTPEEVFGINYAMLIGRPPASDQSKSEALPALRRQSSQRAKPANK